MALLLTTTATLLTLTHSQHAYTFPLRRRDATSSPAITFGDEPYQGTQTYPLNYICDGLKGTCNAKFCSIISNDATCAFNDKEMKPGVHLNQCQTCTQELKDPRCTTAGLKNAVHAAGGQINAAYCTDKYLILSATGAPSWNPNLNDIPMPPGGDNGCRTRTWKAEGKNWKIPLETHYTLLPNAHRSNNNNGNSFPQGAGDGAEKYLCTNDRGAFGLPSAGALGVSIDGQEVFPVFNNGAILTPSWCEVDSCNEHVGRGGGAPHLHGDPFGLKCLYSKINYTSIKGKKFTETSHPPLIGWSLDGPSNYGRYLSLDAPGGRIELDDCGGHIHDGMKYHYHARIQSGKANQQSRGNEKEYEPTTGSYAEFPAFPFGPDQCWKGDISQDNNFWNQDNTLMSPCCGSTNYYIKNENIQINGVGILDTESYCSLPGDFGLGVTGITNTATTTGCVFHNSLKDGAVCNIQCVTGYEMDASNSTLLEFSCSKGILKSPIIQCNVKTDYEFTLTKAKKCTTCIETTSCVSILPTWLIGVIVGGSVFMFIGMCCIVAKCCSIPICCCFQKTNIVTKKKEFTKDVELAEVESTGNNKKVVAM